MLRCLCILIPCLCVSTADAYWQTAPQTKPTQPRSKVRGDVNRYNPIRVLRNPIRAITNPTLVAADASDVSPNELVIGVEMNGESRAYSINQLTGPQREIINDVLGGTAIAATW